jgi:hypothetical protein
LWRRDLKRPASRWRARRPYVLFLGSSAKQKNVHVIFDQGQALDEAGIDIVVVGAASLLNLNGRY